MSHEVYTRRFTCRRESTRWKKIAGLFQVAVLASLGWYLLMPPANGTMERLGAPLSLWTVYESYDSAAECRKARDHLKSQIKLKCDADVILHKGTDRDQMIYFAECIVSDDPRLGPN